uniref:Uncharacterized protein n=1 Tax=Chromera velia CCMP2878 TaxID=1169474 RepID=A0A0G4FKP6_9ALVE|eukprot:Cvel_17502.t1-p1 / transcript=Cvel_17502.t1 / gene=Cvel_17502 / organism=Chromera_velia_CCMP2878 / gene_product=Potassium channel subfamily U member 1, putative / transcript_product=Potassium channel subfamily U member 1, putative / location=Cvel_scaffold1401:22121-33956(-) / protein_length=1734 / sequence_SO=supercontig / SO=protein_coding / is_pseudo=false
MASVVRKRRGLEDQRGPRAPPPPPVADSFVEQTSIFTWLIRPDALRLVGALLRHILSAVVVVIFILTYFMVADEKAIEDLGYALSTNRALELITGPLYTLAFCVVGALMLKLVFLPVMSTGTRVQSWSRPVKGALRCGRGRLPFLEDILTSQAYVFSQLLRTLTWTLIWLINTQSWRRKDPTVPWNFDLVEKWYEELEKLSQASFVIDFCWDFVTVHRPLSFFFSLHSLTDLLTLPPVIWLVTVTGWGAKMFGLEKLKPQYYLLYVGWVRFWRLFGLTPTLKVIFPTASPSRLQILSIFLALLSIVLMFASAMFVVEGHRESHVRQPYDTLFPDFIFFSIVTISTVGYGDFAPKNTISKWFAIIAIALIVMVIPYEVQQLIALSRLPITQIGALPAQWDRGHFVLLIGRMPLEQLDAFLEEVAAFSGVPPKKVVLLTPESPSLYLDAQCRAFESFGISLCVKSGDAGDLGQLGDLQAVQTQYAKVIFVVSNSKTTALAEEDRQTIIRCLGLRKFVPMSRVVVQLNQDSLKSVLLSIGVREVVCFNEVKMRLLASSATTTPGVITLVSNMMREGARPAHGPGRSERQQRQVTETESRRKRPWRRLIAKVAAGFGRKGKKTAEQKRLRSCRHDIPREGGACRLAECNFAEYAEGCEWKLYRCRAPDSFDRVSFRALVLYLRSQFGVTCVGVLRRPSLNPGTGVPGRRPSSSIWSTARASTGVPPPGGEDVPEPLWGQLQQGNNGWGVKTPKEESVGGLGGLAFTIGRSLSFALAARGVGPARIRKSNSRPWCDSRQQAADLEREYEDDEELGQGGGSPMPLGQGGGSPMPQRGRGAAVTPGDSIDFRRHSHSGGFPSQTGEEQQFFKFPVRPQKGQIQNGPPTESQGRAVGFAPHISQESSEAVTTGEPQIEENGHRQTEEASGGLSFPRGVGDQGGLSLLVDRSESMAMAFVHHMDTDEDLQNRTNPAAPFSFAARAKSTGSGSEPSDQYPPMPPRHSVSTYASQWEMAQLGHLAMATAKGGREGLGREVAILAPPEGFKVEAGDSLVLLATCRDTLERIATHAVVPPEAPTIEPTGPVLPFVTVSAPASPVTQVPQQTTGAPTDPPQTPVPSRPLGRESLHGKTGEVVGTELAQTPNFGTRLLASEKTPLNLYREQSNSKDSVASAASGVEFEGEGEGECQEGFGGGRLGGDLQEVGVRRRRRKDSDMSAISLCRSASNRSTKSYREREGGEDEGVAVCASCGRGGKGRNASERSDRGGRRRLLVDSVRQARKRVWRDSHAPFVLVCGWPRTLGVFLDGLRRSGRWNALVLSPLVPPPWSSLLFLEPYSNFTAVMEGSALRAGDLVRAGVLEASSVLVFSTAHDAEATADWAKGLKTASDPSLTWGPYLHTAMQMAGPSSGISCSDGSSSRLWDVDVVMVCHKVQALRVQHWSASLLHGDGSQAKRQGQGQPPSVLNGVTFAEGGQSGSSSLQTERALVELAPVIAELKHAGNLRFLDPSAWWPQVPVQMGGLTNAGALPVFSARGPSASVTHVDSPEFAGGRVFCDEMVQSLCVTGAPESVCEYAAGASAVAALVWGGRSRERASVRLSREAKTVTLPGRRGSQVPPALSRPRFPTTNRNRYGRMMSSSRMEGEGEDSDQEGEPGRAARMEAFQEPMRLHGTGFREAFRRLAERDVVLIGVRRRPVFTSDCGTPLPLGIPYVVCCPHDEAVVGPADRLFLLGTDTAIEALDIV